MPNNPKFYVTKLTRFITFGKAGICLPPIGILIDPEHDTDQLRAHELVHWKQYRQFGLFGFYWRYLYFFLLHGYKNHPFEVEARSLERGTTWKLKAAAYRAGKIS